MTKPIAPIDVELEDREAERVRRNFEERIKQLANRPAFSLEPLGEVTLVDGTDKVVEHKLGRLPTQIITSPVRGAVSTGRIEEMRDSARDRTKVIVLKATGWGATIKTDVTVL